MHTLKSLTDAIGGQYHGQDIALPPVSIDSRTLSAGDLFIAIKGPSFDGHDYIQQAIDNGAAAVMVQQKMMVDVPCIEVEDTVSALGQMAKIWRQQFDLPVIALTGSCGKTTTKEMMAAILSRIAPTLATVGNKNNYYGLPMMLLGLRPHHQFAVIEMGTNAPGEIAYLADITQPTVALITNIRACHLSGLVSLQGVSDEKSAIYRHLQPGGVAVLNQEETFVSQWQQRLPNNVKQLRYSVEASNADISLEVTQRDISGTKAILRYQHQQVAISCPLFTRHVSQNIIAAAAACIAAGVSLDDIALGVQQAHAAKGRFQYQLMPQGWSLIDDTYNASPSSVESALQTLADLDGTRIFVMSNMSELGQMAEHYHQKMGTWIADSKVDHVFLHGDFGLLQQTMAHCPHAQYFDDKADLATALLPLLTANTHVLIKGSRTNRMEQVIDQIMEAQFVC